MSVWKLATGSLLVWSPGLGPSTFIPVHSFFHWICIHQAPFGSWENESKPEENLENGLKISWEVCRKGKFDLREWSVFSKQ